MTFSEFNRYDEDMMTFCQTLTRNVEQQLAFNRLVAEKLHLKAFEVKPLSKDVKEDVAFG